MAELTGKHERAVECLRFYYSCFPLRGALARERAAKVSYLLTYVLRGIGA